MENTSTKKAKKRVKAQAKRGGASRGKAPSRRVQSDVPSPSMPMSFTGIMTSDLQMTHSEDGIVVAGRDLVYTIPSAVAVNSQHYLFCAFPCNPCYWRGTRVAAVAAAYQNYRPLDLTIKYVPQVPVTQVGTVLVGTLWNTPTATESLEQTMVTSNGGCMAQCYVPFSTTIKLGSNLPQNLFTCAGKLDEDHNPFFFIALMRGSDVVPGYFFVEYRFTFKNPLGLSVNYDSYLCHAPEFGSVRASRNVLALSTIPGLSGPGLCLDLEADGECYYQGSPVVIPDSLPVIVYANTPMSVVDPTFTSSVKSVVVFPYEASTGNSISAYPDRAYWNWDTDANFATGSFGVTGLRPLGFSSTLDTISMWVDNAAQGYQLFVYALNLATLTVGALIGAYRVVTGTRTNPSVTIPIVNRGDITRVRTMRLGSGKPQMLPAPLPEDDSASGSKDRKLF